MLSNVKYHLLKMVSSILCRMPYKNILAIGSFLGPAIMNRIPKQRNRGIEQIMTGLLCEREDAERLLNKVSTCRNVGDGNAVYAAAVPRETSYR